jgi:hypothetical protein
MKRDVISAINNIYHTYHFLWVYTFNQNLR